MGSTTYQLLQDFFHQQYGCFHSSIYSSFCIHLYIHNMFFPHETNSKQPKKKKTPVNLSVLHLGIVLRDKTQQLFRIQQWLFRLHLSQPWFEWMDGSWGKCWYPWDGTPNNQPIYTLYHVGIHCVYPLSKGSNRRVKQIGYQPFSL